MHRRSTWARYESGTLHLTHILLAITQSNGCTEMHRILGKVVYCYVQEEETDFGEHITNRLHHNP